MTAAPALRVEGLSVAFRTRSGIVRALDNVSFSVDKGETIALVGEFGIGQIGHRLCGDGYSRSGGRDHRRTRHARQPRSSIGDTESGRRCAAARSR